MIYVTMIFLLTVIPFLIVTKKGNISPIIIFLGIWMGTLFLSSLKLFGMLEVTNKTMNLIVCGIISFTIGVIVCYIYKFKLKDKYKNTEKSILQESINFKFINILLLLGIILVLPIAIKVTVLLINGTSYSDIRGMYYSYDNKESLINNEMIYTLFDWGTAIILSSITPIIITGVVKKQTNKYSIIGLAIFTLLYIYSTAGRSQLFVIAIEFILAYLMNKEKIHKKVKKNISKVVIIMGIIILGMSIFRNNYKEGSVNQWYAYFSLPAPYFSKLVDYVDNENIHTNGIATFYGPYLIIQKVIKGITGMKLPNSVNYFNIINKPQNYWIKIFADSPDYYNAYGTMFYNFYLDFRWGGIIVFSMLYGILMEKIYLDAKNEDSISKQVLYLIFTMGLCNSFIRWQFASPTIFVSFILIKFLINKKQNKEICVNPRKILVFGITENPGGVESVIMNYYRHINREDIQFDFLCNSKDVAYEDEIKKLGGKIYRVTSRCESKIKFYTDMKKFFAEKSMEYSAIWVNVCSLANIDYLKYAKRYGIEKRIIHCHNSSNMDSFIRGLVHKWNKLFLKMYATDFWSCAKDSSEWFYSNKIINGPNYHIIKNAIDCKKYLFDKEISNKYKKSLNLEGKIVLGNIGRLHFQKNQMFLIDVFYELYKLNNKFNLIIVGDGEDKDKIIEKIHSLNLDDSIKLLGIRNDVNNIFQAMDAFIFPSLFEGLPLVLLEAQANGLPIFASDSITENIKISDNFKFISLNYTAVEWANIIFKEYQENNFGRVDNYEKIVKSGYEINNEVKYFENYLERN